MGKRDLQFLVIDDQGNRFRVSPNPERVGVLHRALGRDIPYVVWCPQDAAEKLDEDKRAAVDWVGGELRLAVSDGLKPRGFRIGHETDLEAAEQPTPGSPRVVLVPGLLYQLLARLRRELESGDYRLAGVLLLDTNRGEDSDRADEEPVAAAPIIQEWLRKWLAHVPGFDPKLIRIETYLVRGDQLNEEDSLGNRFLNAHAAERIERAVADLARGHTGASVRLHDAGGIPGVLPILHEAAKLWFVAVEPVSPDEDVRRPRARVAKDPPAALIEARRRARDLIQHGEFTAAEVAVAGLRSAPAWRLAVEAAGSFFACDTDQMLNRARGVGGAVQQLFADLDLANAALPHCLRVGVRGEASLWAGELVQAAILSVTFFEVALLDAVGRTLTQTGRPSCVDWHSGNIEFARAIVSALDLNRTADSLRRSWPHPDVYQPPKPIQVRNWLFPEQRGPKAGAGKNARYNTAGGKQSRSGSPQPATFVQLMHAWQDVVIIESIHPHNPALASALTACWRQLYKPNSKSRMRPAQFRNSFVHVVPLQELVERATQSFHGRGFWDIANGQPGHRFLASKLHGPILNALGIADPARYYARLVGELVAELEKPGIVNC